MSTVDRPSGVSWRGALLHVCVAVRVKVRRDAYGGEPRKKTYR